MRRPLCPCGQKDYRARRCHLAEVWEPRPAVHTHERPPPMSHRRQPCTPSIHPAESTRSSSWCSSAHTVHHRRIAARLWPGLAGGSCSFWPLIHREKPVAPGPERLANLSMTCEPASRRAGLVRSLVTLFFIAPIHLASSAKYSHDRTVFARGLTQLLQRRVGLLLQKSVKTLSLLAMVHSLAMPSWLGSRSTSSTVALPPSLKGGDIHAIETGYLRLCYAASLVGSDRPFSNFL